MLQTPRRMTLEITSSLSNVFKHCIMIRNFPLNLRWILFVILILICSFIIIIIRYVTYFYA